MSRGFFTIAQGAAYQRLAYALALSLRLSQPAELSRLSIGVAERELDEVPARWREVFDQVVPIPWCDAAAQSTWKLENEWKSIYMSPYDETIKLDADMFFPASIEGWWSVLEQGQATMVTAPVSYRGEQITCDAYRRTFTESELPNVYSAFFYFKKTPATYDFFKCCEFVFNNWQRCWYEYLGPAHRPTYFSTDVAMAIAAKIQGLHELSAPPAAGVPTFVHMKSQLQGWPALDATNEDWTQLVPTYFNKDCSLKIANYAQLLPVHYYVKSFMTDRMIHLMEKKLGI